MRKEFIGLKYENEEQKQKILNSYDEYQLRKLTFLNDYHKNDNTRFQYFSGYNNNFHYAEVEKGKDLMHFTSDEIEVLVASCIYNIESTKSGLLSFASGYCSYAKNVLKEIDVNPVDLISAKSVIGDSQVLLSRKLIPLDIFYAKCVEMERKMVKIYNIIPLILARYGIIGTDLEQMRHLQWRDIDRERKIVFITNEDEEVISEIKVDDRFMFWMDKAEHTEVDKYVIAGTTKRVGSGKPLAYPSIYARMNTCFKSAEIKRVGFKDLLFNRQVELLLQLRKERQLTKDDISDMVTLFAFKEEGNITATANLIKRYEKLTGDHILIYTKALNKLSNPEDISIEKPYIVANEIIKKLKMYISIEERKGLENEVACDTNGEIIESESDNNSDNK